MPNKKKVVKKQKYTFEVLQHDDDSITMRRSNSGFNVFELLGVLQLVSLEIAQQIGMPPKPDLLQKRVQQPDGSWKKI